MNTLLKSYREKPNISNIELNCADFTDYDSGIGLVRFTVEGTRGFQVNLDGSYAFLSDVSTEDDYLNLVSSIGPLFVDAWQRSEDDPSDLGFICLH